MQGNDTMPIYPDGRSRTYRAIQYFPELADADKVAHRDEGLLGGWLPAVHKVVPAGPGRWYDLLVFADVGAPTASWCRPGIARCWSKAARR